MLQLSCNTIGKADSLIANMNYHWILFICLPERFDYSYVGVVRKIELYSNVW